MFKGKNVTFTNRVWISFVVAAIFIIIISIFQMIFIWTTNKTFSLFLMPHFKMSAISLKIIGFLIIIFNLTTTIIFIFKSIKWKKTKLIFKEPLKIWAIIIFIILINLFIPTLMPMNFIIPIAFLFVGVASSIILQ